MASFDFLKDRTWRRALMADAFGREFWMFCAAGVLFGALCWLVRGGDVTLRAFADDMAMLFMLLPRVIVALSLAALIMVMLPRDRISRLVGRESGFAGILVATLAGTITPGGPASAYPLLAVLGASGADRGAMVAYITAWATLGLQRVLVWDVPFLGVDFAILRSLVTLALPILAGLIARRLPFEVRLRVEGDPAGARP